MYSRFVFCTGVFRYKEARYKYLQGGYTKSDMVNNSEYCHSEEVGLGLRFF